MKKLASLIAVMIMSGLLVGTVFAQTSESTGSQQPGQRSGKSGADLKKNTWSGRKSSKREQARQDVAKEAQKRRELIQSLSQTSPQ